MNEKRPRTSLLSVLSMTCLALIVGLVSLSPLHAHAGIGPSDTLVTNVTALQSIAAQWINAEATMRTPEFLAQEQALQQLLADTTNTMWLHRVTNGRPVIRTLFNRSAAFSMRVSPLWPDSSSGLNLSGATSVGELAIWDLGYPQMNHQELLGRVRMSPIDTMVQRLVWIAEGFNPWDFTPVIPGIAGHATHCAGTIIASGIDARAHGMSPAADLDAYDAIFYDTIDMVYAAAEGLLVSNHSYGITAGWALASPCDAPSKTWLWMGDLAISTVEDYKFGFYTQEAERLDVIGHLAPYYTIVQAAGNERDVCRNQGPTSYADEAWWYVVTDTTYGWEPVPYCPFVGCPPSDLAASNGYDTLDPEGAAKNALVIGSVTAINPFDPASIELSDFSSCGPTDDGRIKPDLVAPGERLFSCRASETLTDLYTDLYSGTSMANAAVSGTVNLLVQHYKTAHGGVPARASTIKALLVHTATSRNADGAPDYRQGWGLVNALRAAELIVEDGQPETSTRIQEPTLSNGQQHDFFVYCDGSEPLVATMAWTDPPGQVFAASVDPVTSQLVHDLDLRVSYMGRGTSEMPYILDPANPSAAATKGDNTRDNVEKVYIAAPDPGYYYVTVTHKGTLQAAQAYGLVITGANYPGVARYENKSTESELEYAGTPYSSVTFDYDNDGKLDLMLSVQDAQSTIFRCWRVSQDGVPEFQGAREVAFPALSDKPQAGLRGLSVADYNNDGRMDIFGAHATQPRLYCQTASHTFEDKASTTGLLSLAQNSWTGSWADYNRDGWLDLLVTRWGYTGQQPTPEQSGTLLPVSLLANSGGSSIAFSLKNGVAGLASASAAAAISAAWGDVDGDGLQDFVVGDLQGSAQLYMNQGLDEYSHEYWFTEQSASRLLGVAYSKTKISGLQWLDYDGDADLDLAVARYQDASNCVAIMKNTNGVLSVLYWPTLGLTTLTATNGLMTLDYDLNGRPDILAVPAASNGGVSLYAASEPGQTADFVDLAEQSGIDMGRVDGIVAADFNGNDGDPDLYLGRPKGDYKFFYKNAKPLGGDSLGRNYLRLKLVGNTHDNSVNGIGARVYFETTDAAGEPIALMQQVDGGSGRGIQQVPNLIFATGDLARAAKVTVYWPNGRVQTNTSLATSTGGTQYTITEPTTAPALIAGSVTGQYTALPGEAAIWEFNWRTQDWSNPALDRVVVEDNVGQPPECTIGSLELRQDQVGVEVTVEPYPGGGFLHKLVWSGASCVGGCSYKYKVYSYNNGLQMSSTTRYLNIGACLH